MRELASDQQGTVAETGADVERTLRLRPHVEQGRGERGEMRRSRSAHSLIPAGRSLLPVPVAEAAHQRPGERGVGDQGIDGPASEENPPARRRWILAGFHVAIIAWPG